MAESDLCKRIKQPLFWDEVRFSPFPRSHRIAEGYRINITSEKEEDIEEAKEFLKKNGVTSFEDRIATSYSETVQPGDRTLRVSHRLCVNNLCKMWEREFKKSRLGQSLHQRRERD